MTWEFDVFNNAEIRDQIKHLKDKTHMGSAKRIPARAAQGIEDGSQDADGPVLRCDHTAEQAQQRRRTAAAGPFYEYPLLWKDGKIAYVEDVVLIPGPTKLQAL